MNFKLPKFLYVSLPYFYILVGALIMYGLRGWLGGIIGLGLMTYGFSVWMLRKDFRAQNQSEESISRYDDSRFEGVRINPESLSSSKSQNKGPPR